MKLRVSPWTSKDTSLFAPSVKYSVNRKSRRSLPELDLVQKNRRGRAMQRGTQTGRVCRGRSASLAAGKRGVLARAARKVTGFSLLSSSSPRGKFSRELVQGYPVCLASKEMLGMKIKLPFKKKKKKSERAAKLTSEWKTLGRKMLPQPDKTVSKGEVIASQNHQRNHKDAGNQGEDDEVTSVDEMWAKLMESREKIAKKKVP